MTSYALPSERSPSFGIQAALLIKTNGNDKRVISCQHKSLLTPVAGTCVLWGGSQVSTRKVGRVVGSHVYHTKRVDIFFLKKKKICNTTYMSDGDMCAAPAFTVQHNTSSSSPAFGPSTLTGARPAFVVFAVAAVARGPVIGNKN